VGGGESAGWGRQSHPKAKATGPLWPTACPSGTISRLDKVNTICICLYLTLLTILMTNPNMHSDICVRGKYGIIKSVAYISFLRSFDRSRVFKS